MSPKKVNRTPPKKNLDFKVTPQEKILIDAIVHRAWVMDAGNGATPTWRDKMDCQMDIVATHKNGNPLRLQELLAADDFQFAHDVFGIARHLDRSTGELQNFFSPRFSA